MEESIIYQVINSPENPYGKNAAKIQQEGLLRKIRGLSEPSNLERVLTVLQGGSRIFYKKK